MKLFELMMSKCNHKENLEKKHMKRKNINSGYLFFQLIKLLQMLTRDTIITMRLLNFLSRLFINVIIKK